MGELTPENMNDEGQDLRLVKTKQVVFLGLEGLGTRRGTDRDLKL